MITVGVLFLLQYFTPYRFHQTWPILLIAVGAAMAIQRSAYGKPDGDDYSAPGSSSTAPENTSEKR